MPNDQNDTPDDPTRAEARAAEKVQAQADKIADKTTERTDAQIADRATGDRIAAIVYNPIKVRIDLLRAAVEAAEKTAGWRETLWFETSEEDPGQKVTLEALTNDVDVVMVAGGDGTVRAAAEALRGSGVPIGLIPSGTGNLLARNLHLTLDSLDEAVSTAFAGKDRPIDLGVIEVRRADSSRDKFVFLVMAGLGLDAQMIANTDPELKKRVGWFAYVDAIRKALRSSKNMSIRYNLDGQGNRNARVHTVLIGNCGSLPGNILLLPDAAVDDGVFDIVALRPEGFFGWIQVWVKIVWENGVLRRSSVGRKIVGMTKEVRTLRYLKGKELLMRLDEEEEFELDGDSFGKAIAFRVVVDPLALVVKVPVES
ncbi:diacylglycerol/lipid kinase family protein [Marisediminicola senii]|uniref:diacylglycerol/lipid kinase family protein n=1 Tax=Marisediminicola senii TaxID=2711233 RepID=UPI001F383B52|nr:diacylglycerol kinase family protein [Marisediminicola senii]